MANSTVQLLRENLKAVVTTEDVVDEAPPPPPPPDFKPPPVVAIAPDVSIDLSTAPPPSTTSAISNTPPAPPPPVAVAPPPPPAPPTPPGCIPADCNRAHAVTADDYPPVSIRLQEQGIVRLKYQVSETGVVGNCQVITSSGKPRLDTAACTMVTRKWKFKPATRDGKPVAYSDPNGVIVTFALK